MPFGVTFGSREKALAEAIVAEMIAQGVGGSGGGGSSGGGITQAEVQAAIQAASNLDQLETLIATAANNVGGSNSAAAIDDVGNWTINALIKRLLSIKLPNAIAGRIPTENKPYRPDIVAAPPLESTLSISDTATTRGALLSRTRIAISNTGTNPVYIDVTGSITTTKYLFLLQPNELYTDDFHPGLYFFRCATGQTSTIQVREWQ